MTPFFESADVTIWNADARDAADFFPERSVDAIVTSPPYFGLRDYGVDGQIGLEASPRDYIEGLADLLTAYGERALKPQGSLWLNLGDTYAKRGGYPAHNPGTTSAITRATMVAAAAVGHHVDQDMPDKSLMMIPERVALALIDRGWILRNRVVWAKPNGMPTSATDRLATKHEALFHFVRQREYHYDLDAIREPFAPASVLRGQSHRARKTGSRDATIYPGQPGQTLDARAYLAGAGANPGDVWTIPTQPYPEAHFAVFPPELVRRPLLATVPEGGVVLDPFFGSGTTGVMARRLGRRAWGVELNRAYCELAAERFQQATLDLSGGAA